jgi:2-octaprenyl-6-methoxyphenol hydroxylase
MAQKTKAQTKTHKTDLVISGGGIAGLSLAALLGKAGLGVHIIDPAPPKPLSETTPSARTIALMQSSLNIIKGAGVWPKIEAYTNPLKTMRIIDDSANDGNRIDAEFDSGEIGLEQFGFNIPNSTLRAALYENVQKIPSVTVHVNSLKDYKTSDNSISVTLENGDEISAALLVGTDGRKSKVREIAGIKAKVKEYGQAAITCLITHSRSHNDTATEFHRPAGPLAFVPMPGNRSAIVWVESKEMADELLRLKKQDFIAALQDRSKNILGAIELESTPESWPLSSIRAERLTGARIALAAEAAHVMSPVTAQGLNLSLRDIAALAETIADAKRLGLDIGSDVILKKYERRRRIDIKTRVFGVDGMNSIISTDFGLVKNLRRGGLKTVSAFSPLKKFAMRHGLAPELDSGRLAKGLPL